MWPFRSPHHSATLAGLVGGGSPLRPGEISLANNGVLFLDELAEFSPSVPSGIRQPLESGRVTLTRADGNVDFGAVHAGGGHQPVPPAATTATRSRARARTGRCSSTATASADPSWTASTCISRCAGSRPARCWPPGTA
ncbi:MAG: ATP-binding protein [Eggerthellaceae bacterium]